MENLRKNIPEECKVCEVQCPDVETANPKLCLAINSIFVIGYIILGVYVAYLTSKYFRASSGFLNLKKVILLEGLLYCLLRVIRYSWLLGKLPYKSQIILLIDQIIYMWGLWILYLTYCNMLVFWGNILQKNHTPVSWIGRRMKFVLFGAVISVFILSTGAAICFSLIPDSKTILLAFNVLLLILVLSTAISYMIEGWRVLRLLKSFAVNESRSSANIEYSKKITTISLSTSIALLTTFAVVIISTVLKQGFFPHSFLYCQMTHIFYKITEWILLLTIILPLRSTKRVKAMQNHNVNTKTVHVGMHVSESRSKSNNSYSSSNPNAIHNADLSLSSSRNSYDS